MENDCYSLLICQLKTDPFCSGHVITIHVSRTSTCPVKAMHQYASQVPGSQRQGPLFHGGRFSSLMRQNLAVTLHHLLQPTNFDEQHFVSHSFHLGAATTAAAAGLPTWLKTLGRWISDAYETYIQPPSSIFRSGQHPCTGSAFWCHPVF